MIIKISFCKEQLDAAVDFISKNNVFFLGQSDYIRARIIQHMKEIAMSPTGWLGGTMGYTLWGDREFEGMDSDENTIHFDISVNPSLGLEEPNYIEEVVDE